MKEDLDILIARYLEGLAGDEEVRDLDARLRRDPEAREALFLAADQDAELRRILADERDARVLAEAAPARPRRWIFAAAGLAAAALLALAAVVLRPRAPAPEIEPAFVAKELPAAAPRTPPQVPLPIEREAPAPDKEEMPAPETPRPPDAEPKPPATAEAPAPAPAPAPANPKPRIEIKPVAPIPRGGNTVTVVATLADVEGKVLVLTPAGRKPARPGQEVLLESGLETPEQGAAVVKYPDGTEIKLAEGTLVEKLSGNGKHVHLGKGLLYASVSPQPPDQPLVVATPQARAEVLGTRFTLSAGADATRLEVDEGRVRLTRAADGASVEVGAGFMALAAPGWALRAAPQEDVDPIKVDQAIRKGIEHLRGKKIDTRNGNVLLFLTFVHGGVADSDPDLQALLKNALETDLEHTYQVALTAMAFEEFERVKYQGRIHQCAQFLADNIGPKGQTRYGQPTTFVEGIPTVATGTAKATKGGPKTYDPPGGANGGVRERPPVTRTFQVKQKRPGPGDHDHSNMQYAALGLRACHDAGMRFEPALLKLVEEWWREAQENDSGAKEEILHLDPISVKGKGPGSTKATTTANVAPQGWGYTKSGEPRGSMTAGAVGAVCIIDYMLGKDWRQDKDVLEGLQWIAKNFSVTENPKVGDKNYLYYMYGLERAGVLFGTETIGSHRWYREGAKVLLEKQGADGKWNSTVDTCFAILFLKRATRPLVASEDSLRRK